MIERPALQGYACLFDEPIFHDGEYIVFSHGCFPAALYDPDSVGLWESHDSSKILATTGLELTTNADGLAFRFQIDEVSPAAKKIQRCIENSARACVSVGCEIMESEMRPVAGVGVRYITRAKVKEISLVYQGAVPETFVSLVSMNDVDSNLYAETLTRRFSREKTCANMLARLRRIQDKLSAVGAT